MRPTRGQIWSYFRSSSGTSASSSSFCTSCTVTLFFLPKTIPIFVLLWAQLLSITAVENHIYSTLHIEWDAQIRSISTFIYGFQEVKNSSLGFVAIQASLLTRNLALNIIYIENVCLVFFSVKTKPAFCFCYWPE